VQFFSFPLPTIFGSTTVHEIAEMGDEEDVYCIFIQSSEPNIISDEDDSGMKDSLSGRLLNAVAGVVFTNEKETGISDKMPVGVKKEEEDRPLKQCPGGALQRKHE
jgi:hypothetical protein